MPEDKALPKVSNYGQYSSDNYGAHTLYVDLGSLGLYYSYSTIVAFHDGHGLVCSENVWGKTTGKHLNWIQPRHDLRVNNLDFDRLLQEAIARHIK